MLGFLVIYASEVQLTLGERWPCSAGAQQRSSASIYRANVKPKLLAS